MFGQLGNTRRKKTAYTLAEMLVVMAIIALIFLALPPITKKMFKVDETRKAHGRYECFWQTETNADGTVKSKKLYSYTLREGQNNATPHEVAGTYCTFTPPTNVAYFIVYAVGGGGAGASIEDGPEHAADATVSRRDLEDKKQVYSLYNMYKTASNMRSRDPQKPNWLNYFESRYSDSAAPWKDTVTDSEQGSRYDVGRSSDQQTIRYRLGGSAGKVTTAFMPSAPSGVTMKIYPGKGGELNAVLNDDGTVTRYNNNDQVEDNSDGTKTYHRSGSDGGETKIVYLRGGTETTALTARGGKGGNGKGDNQTSMMLVGGKPGDNGASSMLAVKQKDAGFSTILEGETQNGVNETALPYDEAYQAATGTKIYPAGRGGAGETQFVIDTSGTVYYEYDKCYFEGTNGATRYLQRWMDLLAWDGNSKMRPSDVYSNDDEIKNGYRCEGNTYKTVENYVVERMGQCSRKNNPGSSYNLYRCTVGYNDGVNTRCADNGEYVKPNALLDTTKALTNFITSAQDLRAYNNSANFGCTQIDVQWNPTTKDTILTPNPTEDDYLTTKVDVNEEYVYGRRYFSKFYDCKFLSDTDRITCKEKLSSVKAHVCAPTHVDDDDLRCSNGYKPIGTGTKDRKCAPQAGGDGAVVIIW